MKKIIRFLALLPFLILTSCDKKLDTTTIENEEIRVEKYRVSEISTIHQFIDIIDKSRNKVERILEANDGSVDSVFIKQDTLFIQKTLKQPIIYDLAAIKFGYKIVLLEPKNE